MSNFRYSHIFGQKSIQASMASFITSRISPSILNQFRSHAFLSGSVEKASALNDGPQSTAMHGFLTTYRLHPQNSKPDMTMCSALQLKLDVIPRRYSWHAVARSR